MQLDAAVGDAQRQHAMTMPMLAAADQPPGTG